jgi:hypothetical protein
MIEVRNPMQYLLLASAKRATVGINVPFGACIYLLSRPVPANGASGEAMELQESGDAMIDSTAAVSTV